MTEDREPARPAARAERMLAERPLHHSAGPLTYRHVIAELRSPCPEFQVIALRIGGKQLFEAVRVAGGGRLYSAATTDLDELHDVLREECRKGSCR